MKNDVTIRQRLIPIFFLAAGISIILFAMVSQRNLSRSLNESIEMQIENNLNRADKNLNLVLEKYDDVLYKVCTNGELIQIVSDINEQKNLPDSSVIESKLSVVCDRSKGVEGITIITEDGKVLFYDAITESSVNTTWADKITPPEAVEGICYRGADTSVQTEDEEINMFQVIRQFETHSETQESIGTVILSVNVRKLYTVLDAGDNANISIVENGKIIADLDPDMIGTGEATEDTNKYRYTERVNEKSNFTMLNTHSLKIYNHMMRDQITFWILIAVCTVTLVVTLSYFMTRPYLIQIDQLAAAMNEVEKGNFQVEMQGIETDTVEIQKICNGFNQMVKQIDLLINQVRNAVVEQKNAELTALEAQIDPHFLYNTLDTINWKAIEEGQFEISEMVGALADILRYTVKNTGAETTMEQEMHWMGQYILLQNAKLGRELDVEVNIPEELYNCRIHKLLLQPFVENAIKHGFNGKTGELKLTVIMAKVSDLLHITIQDNGNGIDEEKLKQLNDDGPESYVADVDGHLGVSNVRKRLKLYYEDQADLYFESKVGSYTKVHLFIPAVGYEKPDFAEEGKGEIL